MSGAPPRGLRREAPMLLAGALAVFVALAGFALLGYRDAVARLTAERRLEAVATAERLADAAARGGSARIEPLAPLVPPRAALALFDARGGLLDAFGHGAPPTLALPGFELELDASASWTPAASGGATVVAVTPYGAGAQRRFVRLDLPAPTLAGHARGLRWLTPVVIVLSLAAALVVLLYVRALTRPYQALLERAREAGEPLDAADELDGLVATFDRALAALAARRGGALDELRSALGTELDGGFLLLDPEGRLLAATPAAAELLRLPAPEIGVPVEQALAGLPELARQLARAVAEGQGLPRGAVRIESGAGATTVGVTAEPLRGRGGRPRGWLVVVADLTELERGAAQERLAEGLAQLGELSAGVAHELRNGLATLSGWVALARREPGSAATAECLDEIERETAQLARIVEDFLTFARPGTRRLEPVELDALLRRVAADPRLEVAVELRAPDGPARLAGDAELLDRALRNLAVNAAQAARAADQPAPVEIALERRGTDWQITIADRGPGVPATVRERLFTPFVSGRPGGAGLGLALARRILVLHGGTVTLEDRAGGGTCARVLLPGVVSVTKGSGAATSAAPGGDPDRA